MNSCAALPRRFISTSSSTVTEAREAEDASPGQGPTMTSRDMPHQERMDTVWREISQSQAVELAGLGRASLADAWIEGPSGREPFAHQSINIGDPHGSYESFSFGMSIRHPLGVVYEDTSRGGRIEAYFKSTPEQDRIALQHIFDSEKSDSGKFYGPNTCRTYSQDKFDELKARLGVEPSTPPGRLQASRPWWRVPVDFVTKPFSTTTSSSGSGPSR